jgi:N utilization substance protein A
MLTDYTIDVFRDIDISNEEDIYLDEFADEIDSWVIDALKNIGCNTAKSVLAMKPEEIMESADLEEQTVEDVFAILSAEFEEETELLDEPEPDSDTTEGEGENEKE